VKLCREGKVREMGYCRVYKVLVMMLMQSRRTRSGWPEQGFGYGRRLEAAQAPSPNQSPRSLAIPRYQRFDLLPHDDC
jgi:hypothetical protein